MLFGLLAFTCLLPSTARSAPPPPPEFNDVACRLALENLSLPEESLDPGRQARFRAWLRRPDVGANELLPLLSHDAQVGRQFEGLFVDGPALRAHIAEAYRRYLAEAAKVDWSAIHPPSGIELPSLMKFIAITRDLGRNWALSQKRPELTTAYTLLMVPGVMKRLGFSPDEIDIAVTLISGDALGPYATGEIGEREAVLRLSNLASRTRLSLGDFYRLGRLMNQVYGPEESAPVAARLAHLDTVVAHPDAILGPAVMAQLDREARTRLQRQEQLVAQWFGTTGFPSPAELRAKLVGAGPGTARIVGVLEDPQQYDFAMNRPAESRDSILRQGFRSVHVSGESQGATGSDGHRGVRDAAEGSYLGMSLKDYQALDPRAKPQFGFFRPRPSSTFRPPFVSFGDDTWTFKKDRVQPYLTFAIGDSLNQWRDDEGEGVVLSQTRRAAPLTSWDQLFLPWDFRLLAAAYLNGDNANHILNVKPTSVLPDLKAAWPPQERYVELHYWKPSLGLDDVETFTFTRIPPAGEFLKALRARGIAIYDGRTTAWPPKLWNGDQSS